MNISLTNELEDYVSTQVQSGLYNSASEVIREALRNQIKSSMNNQFNRHLLKGREQVERGELILADDAFFESKRNKIRQKHAQ